MKKAYKTGAVALAAMLALTGCAELGISLGSPVDGKSGPVVKSEAESTDPATVEIGNPVSQETKQYAEFALQEIEDLRVIDEMYPMSDYDREDYPHWELATTDLGWEEDYQLDGCDAREATLIRDAVSSDVLIDDYCNIVEGEWVDPLGYWDSDNGRVSGLGEVILDSGDIDIDHIIPLAGAHRLGAGEWDVEKRRQFANDPMNLMATLNTSNRSKGDKLPDEFVPYDPAIACDYLLRYVDMSVTYDLAITPDLKASVVKDLNRCIDEDQPQFMNIG